MISLILMLPTSGRWSNSYEIIIKLFTAAWETMWVQWNSLKNRVWPSFRVPLKCNHVNNFYPRVYVVYRRVYILLCCCCSWCWEAFNQTCQYIGLRLIKHDQTCIVNILYVDNTDMIRNLIRNLIRHDQTWSDTFIKLGSILADSDS
jgi:hypothetical protein